MIDRPAFTVLPPDGPASPIVAHVPHASTVIPAEARARLLLDDAALARERVRMTDWHTDALFAWTGRLGATRFVNGRSRLVVDPERFPDDAEEPMAAIGQGAVYLRTSDGLPLRAPDEGARRALLDAYFHPYHAALTALVDEVLLGWGRCLIVDCHSFPTDPMPSEQDQAPARPDICIGTDAFHTPWWLAGALRASMAGAGFRVEVDRPFAGTIVPLAYYRRDPRVASVMIEVRRGLYCDEATGERRPDFASVARRLEGAVGRALAAGSMGQLAT